jgi:hypothetical protein
MRSARFRVLWVLVVVVLTAQTALAFRPSSRWIFDQMVARQLDRSIRTLKIEQEVIRYGRADSPKGLVTHATVTALSPDGWRREVTLPEGVEREVRTSKKTLIEIPNASGAPSSQSKKTRPDFVTAFLTTGESIERPVAAARLEEAAKDLGVALDVVSYARFDGRISYLIGAKSFDEDKPTIWVDKETLLPLRVVAVKKSPDGKVSTTDVRLRGWGSAEGGSWFPKSIEVWNDGALVEVATTRTADRNVNLDAALFKLPD